MIRDTTIGLLLATAGLTAAYGDWPQFRGPLGQAASTDGTSPPLTWSDSENLRWRTPLPGAGSSSPIIWQDRIFVTCYSGYGLDAADPGEVANLLRHLVCVDRSSGDILWTRTIAALQPADPFESFALEHGYATNTPATDGNSVFAFFGKSGVYAFDFDGNQRWHQSVGRGSVEPHWSSAASVVLHKNLVIVNASHESHAIWALHKQTGEQVWRREDGRLQLAVGTPALAAAEQTGLPQDELVLAYPDGMWALDPATGKILWTTDTLIDNNVAPSVLITADVAFATGGLKGGTAAVRLGGRGDVKESHLLWSVKHYCYVGTPLHFEGHLYWVDHHGIAFCLRADNGELVYRQRLKGGNLSGNSVYASPIRAGEHIYVTSRYAGTFVFPAEPKFEILARNAFDEDESQFNATPAAEASQLFLRSDRFLYCVGIPE